MNEQNKPNELPKKMKASSLSHLYLPCSSKIHHEIQTIHVVFKTYILKPHHKMLSLVMW